MIFIHSRLEGERYSFIRSRFQFYLKCTDIHVVWRDCSLVTSGLLILISLCKCFGCRVKLFLSFPDIGKLVIWLRRIPRHSPDDLPTIKVWNWGQRNFNSMEEIWRYSNRDHKHRQRNGTTTTGESKIFPRERSAHVRCCQNVVQPSSTTESEQVLRSGENVSKQLNFYMLAIIHLHILM